MDSFGCCSHYKECSEKKSCLFPNNLQYRGCQYRGNLEKGKIFYGDQKNMNKDILHIDLETYSSVDLKSCGVYAYAASPDFTILLFAYSLNFAPVRVVDIAQGENIPAEILKALTDQNVIKKAYNANFERTCLSSYFLGEPMPPEQWECSAVHASYLGMPPTLAAVGEVLGLSPDKQKMGVGKSLIAYFCKPCKPTKTNCERTRNLPQHDLEKWKTFKDYCGQDVTAEQAIDKKLEKYPLPDFEQMLWNLDQRINDNGVLIDRKLAENAIECDAQYQTKLLEEAVNITGLDNPKSVAQIKKWLLENEGEEVESLNKKSMPKLLEKIECERSRRVLELRQEMSKTSVKKYAAMLKSIGYDDRIRGLVQFYGANRTGRWAGRLVQVHNLPQNHLDNLGSVRQFIKDGDYDTAEMLYGSISTVLSQLIRTAFIPESGKRFIVSDFSAIEARVIAWLAGEKWRLDVFNSHGKIYEASASQMFKVPIESITKGSPLRQKGKVAELALGYQGNKGALIQMGALDMGLTEDELPELVNAWREANPNIVKLWNTVEEAAIKAVFQKTTIKLDRITFICENGMLFIQLPSGRRLAYVRPAIEMHEKFNKPVLTFEGLNQETKKWGKSQTYGGRLVENIIQATARDCLADSMMRLNKAGYEIVMHVHDEVVIEAINGCGSLAEVSKIMGEPISWADGLPLKAEGFETEFYKKD